MHQYRLFDKERLAYHTNEVFTKKQDILDYIDFNVSAYYWSLFTIHVISLEKGSVFGFTELDIKLTTRAVPTTD